MDNPAAMLAMNGICIVALERAAGTFMLHLGGLSMTWTSRENHDGHRVHSISLNRLLLFSLWHVQPGPWRSHLGHCKLQPACLQPRVFLRPGHGPIVRQCSRPHQSCSHHRLSALSLIAYWLLPGRWRHEYPNEIMATPYGRTVVVHLTILFGGYVTFALGDPLYMVITLALLKTAMELGARIVSNSLENVVAPQSA